MILAGILTPLENVMTHILVWLHLTIGLSWAWSIVALTIIVRILLVPVAVRQIHSMQSLQMHAPEMKAIQQRWKHDRQRQQEELMKFYRENKINPYASCLPLVFQIPIFIALYYTLRHFESNIQKHDPGASINWLHLVNINQHVSVGWGPLLLVIYVVSQLTSSYFMSTQMQSNAQRAMIMFLPIVFVPIWLHFPAGLMIYWVTTNLWTTGQGLVTRRLLPRPTAPPKRTSRTPAKEKEAAAPAQAAAAPAGSRPVRTGPPRRVKKKRGGGRPRR